MAILIAYYSRAGENYFGGSYRRIPVGNTRRVAEQLASLTGGDLLELRQAHPYSDDYRTCVAQARADWQQSVRPELLGLPKDLSGYDRIYLGYPNYCGTMPMRSIPSWSTMTLPARSSAPSAPTRAVASPRRSGTSAKPHREPSSPVALPSTAATWTRPHRP